jgi:hypothetical protein
MHTAVPVFQVPFFLEVKFEKISRNFGQHPGWLGLDGHHGLDLSGCDGP